MFFFVQAAQSKQITIEVETGKQLADSLDKATCEDNFYFNTMLRMLTTRCMMQARICLLHSFFNFISAPSNTHF